LVNKYYSNYISIENSEEKTYNWLIFFF
jgi:hypothetical protein